LTIGNRVLAHLGSAVSWRGNPQPAGLLALACIVGVAGMTAPAVLGHLRGQRGLGLAMVADFRVASPQARFSANFVKLGFHAGFGLTVTLPRLLGTQRAELILMTGRRIKAEQALEWGLVDEVVAAGELGARAAALARELAENAPLAVQATRRTMRGALAAQVLEATDREFEIQAALRQTADFAEGIRAVAERRPGRFTGA
jgi:enoyl-CoA hydratase/carnithine racemase